MLKNIQVAILSPGFHGNYPVLGNMSNEKRKYGRQAIY